MNITQGFASDRIPTLYSSLKLNRWRCRCNCDRVEQFKANWQHQINEIIEIQFHSRWNSDDKFAWRLMIWWFEHSVEWDWKKKWNVKSQKLLIGKRGLSHLFHFLLSRSHLLFTPTHHNFYIKHSIMFALAECLREWI